MKRSTRILVALAAVGTLFFSTAVAQAAPPKTNLTPAFTSVKCYIAEQPDGDGILPLNGSDWRARIEVSVNSTAATLLNSPGYGLAVLGATRPTPRALLSEPIAFEEPYQLAWNGWGIQTYWWPISYDSGMPYPAVNVHLDHFWLGVTVMAQTYAPCTVVPWYRLFPE